MVLTNNVGYLLQHTAFALARQSDQILQERLSIGFSQFKILMSLKWRTNVQQKQIAESLGQTEASISRQIKLLQEQGLVRTRVQSENRRQHLTVLTSTGEHLIEQATTILNHYHAPVFARLSDNQAEVLREALTVMHQEVCSNNRPGACHQKIDT